MVHGDADPVVPFGALALAEEALQLNGVPVTAYSRPGLGHGIDQEGLQLCAMALVWHLFTEALTEAGPRRAPSAAPARLRTPHPPYPSAHQAPPPRLRSLRLHLIQHGQGPGRD